MTGLCGREQDKQVIWEITRREDGGMKLTFRAEKDGAGIADYHYAVSTMLPPWADYMREIREVCLDSRIEVIGRQCFRGMDHLEKIQFLPEESKGCLSVVSSGAFTDCRSLTEIQFPDSLEEIGKNAFQGAERLKSVKIGSGLKKLGAEAFAQNVSLEELSIASEQLEEVGSRLFALNHRLTKFSCPEKGTGAAELRRQIEKIHQNGGEEEHLVEDSRVVSGTGAETTDEKQPDGCARGSLTDTIQYCLYPLEEGKYRLEIAGTGEMPEWVSRGGQPWRNKAGKITELSVGEGIISIGSFAFAGLTALCRVSLPKTLKRLGVASFGECVSLTELRFQEGMEALGCRSVWACVNLETLWLPKTFAVADLMATAYCPGLKNVYYGGSEAQWKQDVIIDNMMERNHALLEARLHFGEEQESGKVSDGKNDLSEAEYRKEIEKIARLLEVGGDGRFHVIPINLGDSQLLSKTGDSTLLIFPKGSTMLIDTGACCVRQEVIGFLRSIQLSRLDYLVFTHPHGDHFGGALELIQYLWEEKGGGIREVWYTGGAMDNILVASVMQGLEEKKVPMRLLKAEEDAAGERPMQLNIDGVELLVYGPNTQDIDAVNEVLGVETGNNVSLVFRFRYGKTVFLTAGDIYRGKERYLLELYGPETFRADVLKMNHHGNFQGNIPEWIAATHPAIAYAETDCNGSSDVMRRYTEAGTVCYSTGLDGMLHFSMEKEKDVAVFHQFDSALRKKGE